LSSFDPSATAEIAGWNQPADQTGGDYYDWQVLPDEKLLVALADVTGHGIGPALLAAVCRAYARANFTPENSLLAAMEHVNSALSKDIGEGRFVTFVAAVCTPGSSRLELLSAGHGPLFVYWSREDRFDAMDSQGLPLGLIPDFTSEPPKVLDFHQGDLLVLTTDGFFEWANAKEEQFGVQRLEEVVRASRDKPPAEIISALYKAVIDFSGGTKQNDDLTAVVIKKKISLGNGLTRNSWLRAFELACPRDPMASLKLIEWHGTALLLLLLLPGRPTRAQTDQFFPEIDAYAKLHPSIRFNFQAKETREAGGPTQTEIGPGFDFFLKPLIHLKRVTAFDLDDSKARPVQFSVGFRYVPSPDKPHLERLELAVTPRWPIFASILLSDRNRADLDWSKDQLTWRYRNKVTLERRFRINSYHPAPYVSAEVFYQSQYQKWTTTTLCWVPASRGQTFRIRALLRTPERHQPTAQSSVQPVRPHP
jgi:Stage II sporulation protein E (SpoIIE)